MDIKKRDFLATSLGIGAGLAAASSLTSANAQERSPTIHANTQPSTMDANYKPRRINKAIELWEDGQPIYYNGACLLYTSPSPRDSTSSRMPSSA